MKIRHLLVGALAMLALNAATTAAASAADEWLINGEELTVKHEIFAEGTLTFCNDKGGPLGEQVCLRCAMLDKGNVGPTKFGEVTEVANSLGERDIKNCENTLKCPAPNLIEGKNLPWKTEVVLSGGEFKEKIGPGTGGEPGFEISCTIGGLAVASSCVGKNTLTLSNVAGGVNEMFPPNAEPSTCTPGGASQGLIEGTLLAFAAGTLSVA
ncbi:MAG TPA: hypothetical protein VFR48_11625 [Solirubrobacteraceae bacterium]|nr:hypothetical protein [Solirubrobacteraceae bacterium]